MLKKRVFIIHAWGGNPGEGWQGWLSDELRKKDFEVIAPQMPNAEEPKIEEWVPFLSDLVGEPDENTFFVGHSIGCQTIMRYLETIDKKVGGAIFIAGWFNLQNLEGPEEEAIAKPWIESSIDFEKIKSNCKKSTAILSDNDPFVKLEPNKNIFEHDLGAEVTVEKGKGHFDSEEKIPIILEKIL